MELSKEAKRILGSMEEQANEVHKQILAFQDASDWDDLVSMGETLDEMIETLQGMHVDLEDTIMSDEETEYLENEDEEED